MKVLFGLWLRLLLVVLFVQVSWASPTTMYEKEPNNTPVEATHFSGAMRLTGLLDKGDQDAYMWKLDDENSQYLWDIALVGVPHAMTRIDIMKVTFTSDGKEVLDYKKFFSFGTRTGDKPIHLKYLLFDKGNYLIAVSSKSKNGSNTKHNYQINIIKDMKASKSNLEKRKNAPNISSNFYPYLFKKNTGWFSFEIDKEESQKLWTLSGVTTIGHPLNVVLEDKAGHALFQTSANKFGKFKLVDLELDEGEYYLKYSTDSEGTKNAATLYSTGAVKIDSSEIEPNNDRGDANTISYRKTIHGKANKEGDYDYFSFKLPFKIEDKLFDLKLLSNDKDQKFYLKDREGHTLEEKSIDNNYTMTNLRLEPNKAYYISVYSYNKDGNYSFKFSDFREANLGEEVEPNDDAKHAYAIPLKKKIHGYLQGDEYDCFAFTIVERNRLWSIVARGKQVERLQLYRASSSNTMLSINKNKGNELLLKNLFLLPGKYKMCLSGKNSAYEIAVHQNKLSDINVSSLDDIEHEPNQNKRQTNELKLGHEIKGTLENRDNEDYFHFTLKNDTHIKLTATPPKDGDTGFMLISDTFRQREYHDVGGVSVLEGIYPSGRYIVELWSTKPSYGLYSLKLEALDFFDSIDKEKNDNEKFAIPIPATFHLKGFTSDDEDWFTFPSFMTEETNITVSGKKLESHIEFYDKHKKYIYSLNWNDETKTYTAKLKSPATSYFVVKHDAGMYDYTLDFTEYNATILKPLDLKLAAKMENDTVAAYNDMGQKVHVTVEIESSVDTNLSIVTHLSDRTWDIETPSSLLVKAGEIEKMPLTVVVPKNVGVSPVATTLKFSTGKGDFKTTHFTIYPKTDAKVLYPFADWGLPQQLLGGLNVARTDLGAQRVIEHNETRVGYVPDIGNNYPMLFDNMIYDSGFYLYSGHKQTDNNVSVNLLSECEVTGVLLNPMGSSDYERQLRDFTVSLSLDGVKYTPVFSGTLTAEQKEQPFVFDKPYRAKYARLTLHNNQSKETKGEIGLGEWKVIAKPESVTLDKAFNIGNPILGGHVVKASRVISSSWDNYILTKENDIGSATRLYKKEKVLSWVVGFKNERIAQIREINWREPKNTNKKEYIKNVDIFISTQTPNGPWQKMPTWHKSDSNLSRYVLQSPIWARYVKFVVPVMKDDYYALPEELQVLEEKPSKVYKSILGEWGGTNYRSYYEYLADKQEKQISVISGNEHKNCAYTLDKNETVKGRVSVFNHEEDWYKVVIDKDNTAYMPTLSGKSSVDVVYTLYNKEGHKIEPSNLEKSPRKHHYHYLLDKGTYWAKVTQPSISVVFAWDNSGSVSPYHTQIFNAVNYYTQTIQPYVDAVNLLCFNANEKLILDDFSDKPTQIQMIFNNFDRKCNDSDAEAPLHKASDVLRNRDGIKGVIIIGDAVGSRDKKLWKVLEEVNPKVFSIRVLSQYSDNNMYEGIMQSWSRINNGTYDVVSNGVEIFGAINRASAILRRPVYYKLKSTRTYQKPKGPGMLSVMFDQRKKAPVGKHFAVELILDASGSMLKRIHGKRRIAIARDVLKKAVRDIIPPKTLVALRVFGHKQADSCRTDLEVKLQPLNAYGMMQRISQVNAKNLAKTPIADSLAKVAEDLKSVKGKKVVILVTDGEETCDGDPAKVIADLKAQGIDIRVNIVGFAIDNQSLKEKFRKWAEIGNGSYFDARDQRSLDAAVKKALQVPFKVYDKQGKMLAKSTVGAEPIVLPEGKYKIVIESAQPVVYEGIIVHGEQHNQVLLQQGGME